MLNNPIARTGRGMEITLARLLRIGVIIAAVVVLIGGIFYLIHHGSQTPNYGTFHGQPSDARSLAGIIDTVTSFQPQAVIRFGFLLLIATPVLRVAFSVIGYAMEKDYKYVSITLIVLAILLYSLFNGNI